MMVVVFCFAIALHLTVIAWQVHRSGGQHLHSAIFDGEYGPGWGVAIRTQPFWPTFWRRSTGIAWRNRRSCLIGSPALMEMCELDNPEIREPLGPYTFAAVHTKEQIEFFEERKLDKRKQVSLGKIHHPEKIIITYETIE
jgi:hypothetical protein